MPKNFVKTRNNLKRQDVAGSKNVQLQLRLNVKLPSKRQKQLKKQLKRLVKLLSELRKRNTSVSQPLRVLPKRRKKPSLKIVHDWQPKQAGMIRLPWQKSQGRKVLPSL